MTLLELAVVLVIIAILASLLLPAYSGHIARSDKARCVANLRNIYVAASGYLQAGGSWPQIPPDLMTSDPQDYAHRWVDALAPFGAPHAVWICPSHQRETGQTMESVEIEANYRIDYAATPFDENPISPRRWTRYPWFFEQGNFHGRGGNLILFSDGSVVGMADFVNGSSRSP